MVAFAQTTRRPVAVGSTIGVGLLAASHAAADLPYAAVAAQLPTLQARFGLAETGLAIIVATLSLSAAMTQPLFGALADRIGPRAVGSVGVVATSMLLALVGVAPSLWLVFGLLFTGGLASAAMHPAFTSLARRHGRGRPGLAVSVYSAGGTLGVALGPLAVLAVLSSMGTAGTPWLMVPGVLLGVATYVLLPADAGSLRTPRGLDPRVLLGSVGGLTAAVALAAVPFVALNSALPLWLVAEHGVRPDAPIIGWTLSAFSLSAAAGAIASAALSARMSRRLAVSGSMVVAVAPIIAALSMEPGSVLFFAALTAAGALLNASLPIAIIAAQDLMPRSVAMASGMVLGLAHGAAGLVYIGVGALQETIGIGVALAASTVLLAPAAGLAFIVLTRAGNTAGAADSCGDLSECRCVVSVGHCIPALCGCQP